MISPAAGVTHAPYSQRIAKVLDACREAGADALLVTHPPNLRYLSGFDGSMGALLVSAEACMLVVDGRYVSAARSLASPQTAVPLEIHCAERSHEEAVAALLRHAPVRRLGVEADVMTLTRFDRLAQALREVPSEYPSLVPLSGIVERVRLIKDSGEIATIRAAAALLSSVAGHILTLVGAGRTEREIAADIDAALRRAGFERPAFDTIVASGPNSALPHARPGERRLSPGDGVVLDFGGVYGGYCVDLTRTVQLPPASEEFARLFEAVRAAQAAAITGVRPGAKATAVDAAARDVLTQHGLAAAFLHGTGHGLGLEVHEAPRIGSRAAGGPDETLQPGMVFTVEPGAYLPGLGGVRLEDDVLVVGEGCEILTNVPIDRTGRGPLPAATPFLAGE